MILEQLIFILSFNKCFDVLAVLDVVADNKLLELGEISTMLGHVSCKNCANHSLSEQLLLLFCEIVSEATVTTREGSKDL